MRVWTVLFAPQGRRWHGRLLSGDTGKPGFVSLYCDFCHIYAWRAFPWPSGAALNKAWKRTWATQGFLTATATISSNPHDIMSSPTRPLDGLRIERGAEDEGQPLRRGPLWVALLVVVATATGGSWYWQRSAIQVLTYAVRQTEERGPRVALNASGYVTARREATVSSKVTGRVVEVAIEEGQHVAQGDALARLDDSNVLKSLQLAEAQLAAAKAATAEAAVWADNAERDFQRITSLAADNIAAAADLDRAQAEYRARQAQLEKLRTEVEVAQREVAVIRQQMEDTIIRAPFAGVVTIKNAQPGEMISPISAGGGFTRTGICTIVDMESLEIEVDVNESYINRIRPNQAVEATLDAYPDWKIPARVIAIIPTADRQKATVKVRVGFEKLDPRILPQMAVKVAFRESDMDGLPASVTFPRGALQKADGRDVVFVVKNGRAMLRTVTLGTLEGDNAVALSGLTNGESVVIQSARQLRDGARVRERAP